VFFLKKIEMSRVSNDHLLWAVSQLLIAGKKPEPNVGNDDASVSSSKATNNPFLAEKLHMMIQNAKAPGVAHQLATQMVSSVRNKIPGLAPTAPSSTTDPTPLSHTLPSVQELVAAKLTFETIRTADPKITGKELMMCGIITSLKDVTDLGAPNLRAFVQHIGHPHEAKKWCASADQWQTEFVEKIKFTFNTWIAYRDILTPADLEAFGFYLGKHMDHYPEDRHTAIRCKSDWLPLISKDEWLAGKQFTEDQWNRFFIIPSFVNNSTSDNNNNNKRLPSLNRQSPPISIPSPRSRTSHTSRVPRVTMMPTSNPSNVRAQTPIRRTHSGTKYSDD
jgi:hypothetical protein